MPKRKAKSESQLKKVRKQRITVVAERLFIDHGLRGVTMELIAEQAQISKVTLYGYFPDKDSVFKAVAVHFAVRLGRVFLEALQQGGSVTDRIATALIAKHEFVADTVRQSVHAKDLFAAKDELVADTFKQLDSQLEQKIAKIIFEETGNKNFAAQTARVVFRSSLGIANQGASAKTLARDIKLLVTNMTINLKGLE